MKLDIGRAAKFFHIFMSPSVSAEAFNVDKPVFLYDSPERYDDGQHMYGIAAELHHAIPEKYLTYLRKHESLVKEVCSQVVLFEIGYLSSFTFILFYFISSFRAYPLDVLLLWNASGATQAVFLTHLDAPLIPECQC